MSLKAQLNVDADGLADAFIADNPDYDYSTALVMPTSGIQLEFGMGTITHKMKKEVQMARWAPQLRAHLEWKFGWAPATFDDIDWESFRRAMNGMDKNRVTLTKHVNNYIPTGTRLHREDPKYPKGCPTCDAEEETAPHLVRCPNRAKWKNDCVQAVHKHFDKDDGKWDCPLELRELLLEGLRSVMDDRDPSTINYSPAVAHVYESQTAIGWEELFRGRLSTSWRNYQSEFLGDKADKKINGQTWSAGVAKLLLQQWLKLWLDRNGDRHGRDYQSQKEAERRQAIREVEQLYEYRGTVREIHNWILATPLEQHTQKKTYVLRAWISSFGPILKKSHEYQTRLETG